MADEKQDSPPSAPLAIKAPLSTSEPKTGEGSVLRDEYRRPDGEVVSFLEQRSGAGVTLKFEVECWDREGNSRWCKTFHPGQIAEARQEFERWQT
jgi:hypothetical protein